MDLLTRVVRQNRHYRAGRIKPGAFMPPPDGELSTWDIDGLGEAEIWALCQAALDAVTDEHKTVLARGDFSVGVVIDLKLRAIADSDPPRHVNVVDWPTDKELQKSIAQELAERCKCSVPPAEPIAIG